MNSHLKLLQTPKVSIDNNALTSRPSKFDPRDFIKRLLPQMMARKEQIAKKIALLDKIVAERKKSQKEAKRKERYRQKSSKADGEQKRLRRGQQLQEGKQRLKAEGVQSTIVQRDDIINLIEHETPSKSLELITPSIGQESSAVSIQLNGDTDQINMDLIASPNNQANQGFIKIYDQQASKEIYLANKHKSDVKKPYTWKKKAISKQINSKQFHLKKKKNVKLNEEESQESCYSIELQQSKEKHTKIAYNIPNASNKDQSLDSVKFEVEEDRSFESVLPRSYSLLLHLVPLIDSHLNFLLTIRQQNFIPLAGLLKYVRDAHGYGQFGESEWWELVQINSGLYSCIQTDSGWSVQCQLYGIKSKRVAYTKILMLQKLKEVQQSTKTKNNLIELS